MDAQQLFQEFIGSGHGQQALSALSAQGVSSDDAQQYLSHATEAAHAHVEEQAGILGNHPGRSFFVAFAAGLVKGDGIIGAIEDGGEGVIAGRIAEAIASRAGIDSGTASSIAAAATPFVVSFIKERLG